MSNYVDKYPVGSVSNSMLEAIEHCPLKWWTLYEKRAELLDIYDRVLDSLQLGILVHAIVEKYPTDSIEHPFMEILNEFPEFPLNASSWILEYTAAVAATYADAKRQGKEYKATPGSEYWSKIGYWAKNYKHLDAEKEVLNLRLKSENNWLCDIEPIDFILRALACLENYNKMLGEISLTDTPAIEESFQIRLHDTLVVGTIDRYEIYTGVLYITDFKTGAKKYTSEIVVNMNQFNLYYKALDDKLDTKILPPYSKVIFRVVALEQGIITEVDASIAAYEKYYERLRRSLSYVKLMRQVSQENLTGAAGKALTMGCPCVLNRIEGTYRCNLI